jgi:hypothetical protein
MIFYMFNQAKDRGFPPGIILLQEYHWASHSTNGLAALRSQLGGEDRWAMARQWDDGKSQQDAVVLYDTTIYKGRELSLESVLSDAVHGRFETRWAAAQLGWPAADDDDGPAARLQFLAFSYHGRDNKKKDNATTERRATKLKPEKKRLIAQQFVASVAAAARAAQPTFGSVPRRDASYGAPAVIGGDWNVTHLMVWADFPEIPSWICTKAVPPAPEADSASVRAAKGGEDEASEIDYFASVNVVGSGSNEVPAYVTIGQPVRLHHREADRAAYKFDHDPILATFVVEPRSGRRLQQHQQLETESPQRSARLMSRLRSFFQKPAVAAVAEAPTAPAKAPVVSRARKPSAMAADAAGPRDNHTRTSPSPSPTPPVVRAARQPLGEAPPAPRRPAASGSAPARPGTPSDREVNELVKQLLQPNNMNGNMVYRGRDPPRWWPAGVDWSSGWRRVPAQTAAVYEAVYEAAAGKMRSKGSPGTGREE